MKSEIGEFSKSQITDIPADLTSQKYKEYAANIPCFKGQAVYVYSFEEGKMLFAKGWEDLLGYKDSEMSMMTFVLITTPRYAKFSYEINDKALMFLNTKKEQLEEYSFTLETEKVHKNGEIIPIFHRAGVFKSLDGQITEIIGMSQRMESLRRGKVMQYAAYGPDVLDFEGILSKELFDHIAISRKEKEALKMAADGLSFKEIAYELKISQSAIEKRIIPMYKRFGVKSLPHLINFAHENHIL